MITWAITAIDFLLAGLLFWPISFVFGLWAYNYTRKDDNFPFSPFFILAATYAMIIYHFKWYSWLADWHNACYAVAGYIIAGMTVAFIKWVILVVNFRKAYMRHTGYSHFRYKTVDQIVMLDWERYSISSWVTYWPFHALYCVFEPARIFIEWLAKLFRGFFEKVAELGAVQK